MQVTIASATSKAQNTLTCTCIFYKLPNKLNKKKNSNIDFVKIDFLVIFDDFSRTELTVSALTRGMVTSKSNEDKLNII